MIQDTQPKGGNEGVRIIAKLTYLVCAVKEGNITVLASTQKLSLAQQIQGQDSEKLMIVTVPRVESLEDFVHL